MNGCLCSILVITLALAGCGKKEPPKSPLAERKSKLPAMQTPVPAAGTPAHAAPPPPGTPPPPGALQPVGTAAVFNKPGEKNADGRDVGLTIINEALQTFVEDTERLPNSLEELVKVGRLTQIPAAPAGKRYAIDPEKKEAVLASE